MSEQPELEHHGALRRGTGHDGWQRAWPLRKPALLVLGKGAAVLLLIWTASGLLFMGFLDDGPVGDADRAVSRWLADHRTPTWNSVTWVGSMMSDTAVKVVLVIVGGAAMIIIWRRWHDGVFLVVAVCLEAAVFVISSLIVGRDRPPVARLDPPAPSGSFPSGHSGAAVAFYAGLFIVVCWHTRNRAARWAFGVLAVGAPLAVGASRAYRGMHHPIDVIAGLLLGLASLYVARASIAAGVEAIDRDDRDRQLPERVRRLDLASDDGLVVDRPLTTAGATR
jgi:membrane-associated phospholipid phosphatase